MSAALILRVSSAVRDALHFQTRGSTHVSVSFSRIEYAQGNEGVARAVVASVGLSTVLVDLALGKCSVKVRQSSYRKQGGRRRDSLDTFMPMVERTSGQKRTALLPRRADATAERGASLLSYVVWRGTHVWQ